MSEQNGNRPPETVLDGTGKLDCPHCDAELLVSARATAEMIDGKILVDVLIDLVDVEE